MTDKTAYENGMPVMLSALRPGNEVVVTGMTCMPDNSTHVVKRLDGSDDPDGHDLYVSCADGKHMLDGQSDGKFIPLVGVRLVVKT